MLVTFRVKNIVSFCVKKLLHFALKLDFASKVVTFRVNVTFRVHVTFCGVTHVDVSHKNCEIAPLSLARSS